MDPIVIIGSGLAGYTVLREFRKRDQATPVTLICADDGHFYSKPNLSNALAACRTAEQMGDTPREKMAADLNARSHLRSLRNWQRAEKRLSSMKT